MSIYGDIESIDILERFMGCPNTLKHVIQALSSHFGIIKQVGGKTGNEVCMECASLGWEGSSSNWLPVAGNFVGNNDKSRRHTGLWAPPQPGGAGMIHFAGGNYNKPFVVGGDVTMADKGRTGGTILV